MGKNKGNKVKDEEKVEEDEGEIRNEKLEAEQVEEGMKTNEREKEQIKTKEKKRWCFFGNPLHLTNFTLVATSIFQSRARRYFM